MYSSFFIKVTDLSLKFYIIDICRKGQ